MKRQFVLTLLAAAVVTLVIALTGARSGDAGTKGPSCPAPATTAAPATGVFQGCWTFFSSGSCRAVYRDGDNWTLCGKCGPTGEPNPNGCSSISPQTLATGLWCS
jgi:hypothetical protein